MLLTLDTATVKLVWLHQTLCVNVNISATGASVVVNVTLVGMLLSPPLWMTIDLRHREACVVVKSVTGADLARDTDVEQHAACC